MKALNLLVSSVDNVVDMYLAQISLHRKYQPRDGAGLIKLITLYSSLYQVHLMNF